MARELLVLVEDNEYGTLGGLSLLKAKQSLLISATTLIIMNNDARLHIHYKYSFMPSIV